MNHTVQSAAALAAPALLDADARSTEPTVHDRADLTLVPSASACLVWPWCAVTGDHEMHTSHDVTIEQPGGGTVLGARVMAEDGRDGGPGLAPFIGYCETDLTPDALRAEVTQVRAALPRLEALADIAKGIPPKLSTAQVLDDLDRFLTTNGDPKSTPFVDYVKEQVAESDDPTATAEDIAFTIAHHRARKSATVRQALTEFLTEHNITQIPANGPNGHVLTGPIYFRERDGRRFLVTPVGAAPAETLEYLRGAFTAQEQSTPEVSTWSITTESGATVSGYLPAWTEDDPSKTDLPDGKLHLRLSDVTHYQAFPGQPMVINTPFGIDGGRDIYEENVFCATITCSPHSPTPAHRVPTATITVVEDCVMEDLDPQGVTDVAAKLRAQADRLDQVAQQLADASTDWVANTEPTT
ncbi:hypothetical protein [Streptomyces sp. SID13588]|uniref:DUF6907 domain-containing protein n=1 Tax=Streptomyces sp. SID13588 TaxID=2706051 RepID=UPI0013CB71AC|nr:hypothetical protein [Streptomyces sp. SID13588]NEA73825.1 hypothetical protein [Streptomyces sp. SID13588]